MNLRYANFNMYLDILSAFYVQRWSHLIVFILGLLSLWCNQESKLPDVSKSNDLAAGEKQIYMRKVLGRDTGSRTFARLCDTLSIFQYQTAVFIA